MFDLNRDNDTICAISTSSGTSGIIVVRVSGEQSLEHVRKLCSFIPAKPESHRIYYGLLKSLDGRETIDEVLVSYFAKGRSFTGEQTLEISCHGSPQIAQALLHELIDAGCRLADKGEFTYRAFMNGRIDLVQAESVLALIESQSKSASRMALRQLQGEMSATYKEIENDLTWVLANLEANIDFAAEDIVVAADQTLQKRLLAIQEKVNYLINSYSAGRALKEGVQVALIGEPNSGKSSLLNAVLRTDKAIVNEMPGTTRDWVEGEVKLSDRLFKFVDTAGLRQTLDPIEKQGIEKTKEAVNQSDYIIYLHDLSQAQDIKPEILADIDLKNLYAVGNKSDLCSGEWFFDWAQSWGLPKEQIHILSAKTRSGVDELTSLLAQRSAENFNENSQLVLHSRHYEILNRIKEGIEASMAALLDEASPEFIAFELQSSIRGVHELLGLQFDDQVMDRVFSEFCLGK